MASGYIPPRPPAQKPAAPKTSYNIPAVIAKPTAKPSSSFGGSGFTNLPKAGSTVNKPKTGGSSSNQAAIDKGFAGLTKKIIRKFKYWRWNTWRWIST